MFPLIVAGAMAASSIYSGIRSNKSLAKAGEQATEEQIRALKGNYNKLKQQGTELSASAKWEASNVYRKAASSISTARAITAASNISGSTAVARELNIQLQGEIEKGSILSKGNAGLVELGYQSESAYDSTRQAIDNIAANVKANTKSPLALAINGLQAGMAAYGAANSIKALGEAGSAVSTVAGSTSAPSLQAQYFSSNLGTATAAPMYTPPTNSYFSSNFNLGVL